jgi:hypothetical protein
LLRFGLVGAAIGIAAAIVVPNIPRSQQVRLHLGPGSSRVVHVAARIAAGKAEANRPEGTWDRQASFRFEHGAPPSVMWNFELPNGEADLEVELASSMAVSLSKRFHVELTGKETNVELGEAMRGLE